MRAVFRALPDMLSRLARFRPAAHRVFSCGRMVCGSVCWLKRLLVRAGLA